MSLLLVVLESSAFAFEVPTGVIADSFSREWSIVIGYVIWGAGFLFVSGAPEAWLADEADEDQAASLYIRGAQLGQVSTVLGIAASTALALAAFAGGTVLGNLCFVWSSSLYLAAMAFCLIQVLRTASKPIFIIWLDRHTPSAIRATMISLYWQSKALGHILFVPVLGALGALSTLRIALTAASLALLPVIPLYRRRAEPGLDAGWTPWRPSYEV